MKTKELVIGLWAGMIILEAVFAYEGLLENPYDNLHLAEKPYYNLISDAYTSSISRSAIGATAIAISGIITIDQIDEMPIKYFNF